MVGYLFMAFTLALFGLYFTAINLQQGYPEIGYALQNSAFILLIAVPVLTMRVLSEEQKNKTDQLLLTAYFGRCVRFLHHREPGHRSRCRLCDPVPVLRGERYRKLLPGRSRKLFLCFLYHHCTGMPLDRQYD